MKDETYILSTPNGAFTGFRRGVKFLHGIGRTKDIAKARALIEKCGYYCDQLDRPMPEPLKEKNAQNRKTYLRRHGAKDDAQKIKAIDREFVILAPNGIFSGFRAGLEFFEGVAHTKDPVTAEILTDPDGRYGYFCDELGRKMPKILKERNAKLKEAYRVKHGIEQDSKDMA
jgi:hypothetical protein